MKRLLVALLLLVTACSGSSRPQARPTPSPTPGPTVTATPPTAAGTPTGTPTPPAPAQVGPVGEAVPAGFEPQSATFVSDRTGWVLGVAAFPARPGSEVPAVARTRDGGRTWRAFRGPRTAAADVVRLRFADLRDGFVTGTGLWATHDGGGTWAVVPGHRDVAQLEAAAGRAWLVEGTTLLSLPVTGGASTREAVLRDPGQLAVHGLLALVGERATGALLLAEHGRPVRTLRTPCEAGDDPVVALRDPQRWLLVCAGEPGAGQQPKTSWRTSDAGAHWARAGDPPARTGTWVSVTDGADRVFDSGGVSVSRDADRTWVRELPATGGVSEGGFVSAVLGYAIGGFGGAGVTLQLHRAGRWSEAALG